MAEPRSFSFDEMLASMAAHGRICRPFTADERALAWAVAEAQHFARHLVELPARAPHEDSDEAWSYHYGIWRVNNKLMGRRFGIEAPAKGDS
jgi:hypothetical protein